MIRRISRILMGLFVLAMAFSGSAAAQILPRSVAKAAIQHLVTSHREDGNTPVILLDRFPQSAEVSAIAEELGVRGGPDSELRVCDPVRRKCRLLAGNRAIQFHEAKATGERWKLRIMISTQVETDGEPRLFAQLREITVANVRGGWTVTQDQLVMQS
jgi:hypothetical protein